MKENIRTRKDGSIKLIAVNNKYRNIPFFTTPLWDGKRRKFRKGGQEDMSKAELAKCELIISEDEHYPVSHNEVLDLSDNAQREKAAFLCDQDPFIVIGAKNVKPGETLFYIEDRETEAKEFVANTDNIFEALKIIDSASIDDYKDMCLMLSLPTAGSKTVLLQTLKAKAMKEPEKIIKLKNGDYEEKLTILKLIDAGVLKKGKKDSRIYDGEILIARNLDEAVLYLKDKANEAVIDIWMKNLGK